MSGWTTNGMVQRFAFSGAETFPFDTNLSGGQSPESASATLLGIALADAYYTSSLQKTMVAGSRYIVGPIFIGSSNDVVTPSQPLVLNGVNVLVGGTGGTDKWIAELHDATGVLLATSNTAGVTTGTASQWMQLPFYSGTANTPYSTPPGTYWLVIQSNGTTATLATYNAPTHPLFTGSATGTFGTAASITIPTTYTANLGPVCFLF